MRIAQVSTLGTPVRATGAGSIESLVYTLTDELTRAGHEVTVFAAGGSRVSGALVETLPGPYGCDGAPGDWQACEWINLCAAIGASSEFDVLHSHAYLWGVPLEPLSRCPIVHTLHVAAHQEAATLWERAPEACVSAISRFQWRAFEHLRPSAVIPHGIDAARHTFRERPEGYACFLGRFVPGKGPLEAIATARALGLPLRLAGPRNDYFDRHVAPLVDGHAVSFAGPIGGDERDALLGGASLLLYPVQAPEPFGLVMVEAMMSGTPVAAYSVGAVPEVVDEGVTGSCTPAGGDLVAAARRALELDRRLVRERAEERFAVERMAGDYLALYEQVAA